MTGKDEGILDFLDLSFLLRLRRGEGSSFGFGYGVDPLSSLLGSLGDDVDVEEVGRGAVGDRFGRVGGRTTALSGERSYRFRRKTMRIDDGVGGR